MTPKIVKTGVSDGIYMEVSNGVQAGNKLIVGEMKYKIAAPGTGNSGESNPFMPARPGQKKK